MCVKKKKTKRPRSLSMHTTRLSNKKELPKKIKGESFSARGSDRNYMMKIDLSGENSKKRFA